MATTTGAADARTSRRVRLLSGINLVLGIWLAVAAFLLTMTGGAFWNDLVGGLVVAVLAAVRVARPTVQTKVIGWINAAIGAWFVVAPYALDYLATAAYFNDMVVGAGLLIFGLWSSAIPPTTAAAAKATAPAGDTSSPRVGGMSTSDPPRE